MRDIKFRVWDGTRMLESWHSFYINSDSGVAYECYAGGHGDSGSVEQIVGAKVMQFTGLLDKNGKEIYEGDIWEDADLCNLKGPVVFKECRFIIEWTNGSSGDLHTNVTTGKRGKIIGNIYQNPDLLTEL